MAFIGCPMYYPVPFVGFTLYGVPIFEAPYIPVAFTPAPCIIDSKFVPAGVSAVQYRPNSLYVPNNQFLLSFAAQKLMNLAREKCVDADAATFDAFWNLIVDDSISATISDYLLSDSWASGVISQEATNDGVSCDVIAYRYAHKVVDDCEGLLECFEPLNCDEMRLTEIYAKSTLLDIVKLACDTIVWYGYPDAQKAADIAIKFAVNALNGVATLGDEYTNMSVGLGLCMIRTIVLLALGRISKVVYGNKFKSRPYEHIDHLLGK